MQMQIKNILLCNKKIKICDMKITIKLLIYLTYKRINRIYLIVEQDT